MNVIKNFLWRLAERVGAQGVKLLVELVLARILLPEQYGVIAMVAVFITVFNVFVDSGLGNVTNVDDFKGSLQRVSPLLETRATPEQKHRKIDLVDFLYENYG